MEIKNIELSKLVHNNGQIEGLPANPRKKNKTMFEKLVASIEETPEMLSLRELLVYPHDSKYIVIAGNMRLNAMKKLGFKDAPCKVIEEGTAVDKLRAYTIKDNVAYGEWDNDLLAGWDNLELDKWGVEVDFTQVLEEEEAHEDNFDESEVQENIVQPLEVWQLGEHRLMCGDSTSVNDVAILMGGVMADMVFTDPPYGVSAAGGRSQTKEQLNMKAIANDDLRGDSLTGFLDAFIAALRYKPNASIYICYPWATQKEFTEAILNNGLKIKNCIIWDKKSFGLNGHIGYRPQYEMIYFCCPSDFVWYGDKAQSNIWQVSREIKRAEQGNHPTPKPIELIATALKNSSKAGDIVVDVFGGSGSTLIACEQLKRCCYTMELDPHYCDVIIARWEKLTGNKAIKIS